MAGFAKTNVECCIVPGATVLTEVARDGSRRVYAQASGSERRRAYAIIPGGLIIGPLPWVKEAVSRLSPGLEPTRIATLAALWSPTS